MCKVETNKKKVMWCEAPHYFFANIFYNTTNVCLHTTLIDLCVFTNEIKANAQQHLKKMRAEV
jgi:hypothetical protein